MEMKRFSSLKVTLAFFLFQLFGSSAFAGSADGVVVSYWAHYFNNVFAFSVANKVYKPACDTTTRFAVDVSTDKGKTIAAAIMAAKSSNAQVHIEGINTCAVWGDSEDVMYIQAK